MADKINKKTISNISDQLKNIETDFDQFNIYSTDYDKSFDVDYTNMDEFLGIINPLKYKQENIPASSELSNELKNLLDALHGLEACLIKAGPELKIRLSAFGIPEVKACIQARDFSILKEKLELVIKNIDMSITTLVEYGFNAELRKRIAEVNIDNYLMETSNREALKDSDTLWNKLVIDGSNKRTGIFKSSSETKKQIK